ncbi:MAG TPA: hypothetical protein VED43_03340 [Mycobacterium sp.]|nr:hypothetical protein [Mycobacterium sp.]
MGRRDIAKLHGFKLTHYPQINNLDSITVNRYGRTDLAAGGQVRAERVGDFENH